MPPPTSTPLVATLARALAAGWATFRYAPWVSAAYAGTFALIGAGLMGGLLLAGRAPLVVPAAGAFMLVGPPLLAGFMAVSRCRRAGRVASLADVVAGFRQAPAGVWVIALVCALLFMVFVTDAVTLYSFMIGRSPVFAADLLQPATAVTGFLWWSSLGGVVLALILYAISVFAVPLLIDRRADLVTAVSTSVRTVLRRLPLTLAWALLLATGVVAAILLLPLLPVVLPVFAYAGEALYRELFADDR